MIHDDDQDDDGQYEFEKLLDDRYGPGLLMFLFVEACSNSNPKKHISYHVSILGWLKLSFIVIFLPAKLKDTFGLPPTQ